MATLALFFNDTSVARESGLLTYISVFLLLSTATIAILHSYVLTNYREMLFWAIAGSAFIYLALDEYYQFHERLDKWVHRVFEIQETALTDELDGALVLLYWALSVGVVVSFYNVIKQYPQTLRYLVIAFFFALLMIVLDLMHTGFYFDNAYFEEASKVLSEYFFLLAFVKALQVSESRDSESLASFRS